MLPLARRFHIIETVCVFQGIKNKVSILAQLSPDENHPGNAGNENPDPGNVRMAHAVIIDQMRRNVRARGGSRCVLPDRLSIVYERFVVASS